MEPIRRGNSAVEDAETEDVHEEKKSPFSKLTKLITSEKGKEIFRMAAGFPADQASGGY